MMAMADNRPEKQHLDGPAPSGVDVAIGQTIRLARTQAGLSMTTLAQRSGVSQPYLSQLERGLALPSISTLYRVANALGVSPQDLLPRSQGEYVVTRADDVAPTPIEDAANAAMAQVLIGSPDKLIQVQLVTVGPDENLGDWFDHSGEEFLFILEGTIEVDVRGSTTQRLDEGDAIWYPATQPHRWRLAAPKAARVLVMSAAIPESRSHS